MGKKQNNDSFIFYTAYIEKFQKLTAEQFRELVTAMSHYIKTGEISNFTARELELAFDVVKYDLDRNSEKYEKKCETNSKAINSRWQKKEIQTNTDDTNVYERIQTNTNETNDTYNDNDTDNNNDNEKEKENVKHNKKTHTCDCSAVVTAFNDLCVSFPRVQSLTETRKRYIKILLGKYTLDEVKEVFRKAEATDFLKGAGDHGWKANFDWIVKEGNFLKVKEGNYDKQRKYTDPPKPEPIDTYDLPDFVARAEDY